MKKIFPYYKTTLFVSFAWIFIVQGLFYFFHQQKIKNMQLFFLSQLEKDIEYNDFKYLLRTINQLQILNLIKCATIKVKKISEIPIIESPLKNCSERYILNLQSKKTYTLSSSKGEVYHLTVFMGGSQSFIIALWLSRAFGVVVCFLLSFFYGVSKKKDQELLDLKLAQLRMMEEKATMKEEQAKAVEEVARQVSHDIRSPLTALNVALQDLDSLPERYRILIRTAVNRINDIANNLLHKSKPSSLVLEKVSLELLSSLVSLVLAEKRMQFRSYIGVEINFVLESSFYGLFARVEAEKFKRVLSNFINNAVEALPNGKGKIEVGLSLEGDSIQLYVKDNGKGIPSSVLDKLGKKQLTYGKEGTESGSGIGIYSARKMVEKWGGRLHIESEWKKGSAFFILLPKEEAPSWFVPEIKIRSNMKIVILDDDIAIHEIWKDHFDSHHSNNTDTDVELVHFSSSKDLKKWHLQNSSQNVLYLMDYELIGERETGLDLIEKLRLNNQAILITSHFEHTEIRERCRNLCVKLIPKELAPFVPISSREVLSPDAILIDDDVELIHAIWKSKAGQNNKVLYCFASIDDFLNECKEFDKKTPIYVDSRLANNVKGEIEARKIHDRGFREIYLASGDDSLKEKIANNKQFSYIKKVMGKEPVW